MRRFLIVALIVCAPALRAETQPAGTGQRYIVVLKSGKSVPDLARYGGKVEHATLWGVAVLVPPDRVDELRHDPAVKYLQKAALGPVQSDDAASSPRVAPTSLRTATDQAPPTWTSGTYAYDGAGNIMGLGPNGDGRASTFIYDAASRLTQATIGRAAGDRTETYGYDAYGNLTSRAIAGGVTYANNVNISTNQLQAPATYDAAGDLTTLDGTTTYAYDPFSMMREKDSASGAQELYIYTPSDERIGIDTNVTWEWTVRDFDGKPLREYVSDAGFSIGMTPWLWVEDYVWRDGQLLGADRPSEEGGRRHFHVDHLGSPRLMTDAHGSMIAQHDYAPFGSEITPVNQELVAGFDREEPLNFTGHRRDFDRSTSQDNANYIDYMHARYYETNYGRFMEVDPVLGGATSPQSWNRYAYLRGNPLSGTDPDGRGDPFQLLDSFATFQSGNGLSLRGLLTIDHSALAEAEKHFDRANELSEESQILTVSLGATTPGGTVKILGHKVGLEASAAGEADITEKKLNANFGGTAGPVSAELTVPVYDAKSKKWFPGKPELHGGVALLDKKLETNGEISGEISGEFVSVKGGFKLQKLGQAAVEAAKGFRAAARAFLDFY